MYKLLGHIILLNLALVCCNFPAPVGEDIVEREVLDIIFIDTLGIRLSTVVFDSIETSNTSRLLVGHNRHEDLGSITASAFVQLGLDSLKIPDEEATYQYAELQLFYDGYYHFDTTNNFSITVHELNEELELNEDDYLTNISSFNYENNVSLGLINEEPEPQGEDDLVIQFSDDYAQVLFDSLRNMDEDDFREDFTELFPGLILKSDTSLQEMFLGFGIESRLVIHYRESSEDEELVFPLNGLRYNQILNDRSSTSLAELTTRREALTSLKTGNQAYLHNGIGMAIKLEIPFLRELRAVLQSNLITEANLILRPVKGTYSNLDPLPQELAFSEIDKLNRVEIQLDPAGNLIPDEEFDEETQYFIQITSFVQEKIQDNSLDEHSILIQGTDQNLGTTVDQVVIGDRFNEFEASLELFVLDYIIEN